MSRTLTGVLAAAAAVFLLSATAATATAATAPRDAAPTGAIPTVGALSLVGYGQICTGTVLNTPKHNIVLTAAHCIDHLVVHPPGSAFSFTPGYDTASGNQAPYGKWSVKAYHLPSKRGILHRNPDYDVALFELNPNGQGQNIQDVVGGQDYQINAPISGSITSIGYPIAAKGRPYYCGVPVTVHPVSGHKDEFQADCGKAFGDGVSGAAFLVNYDANTQHGTVVASVGGDNEGGDSSGELTYGVRLDNEFQSFLNGVG
ncbi:trypsin-like serine peptidase [Solihabitans fulvus]|uniref:trypsin-like serine peptidase n=1 Tax=Solihabitans fulvus TaxID=1892852 RepID=UPI00166195D1|nr:trypsin-like serine protease [Solihabitans fulvus]